MGRSRSRSRSPKRRDYTRRRSRSLSRERDVEKRRRFTERRRSRSRSRSPSRRYRRSRSRSRSPRRRRSRTPSPRRRRRSKSPSEEQAGGSHKRTEREERPEIDASKLEDMTEDEIEMMKVMGFASFDTTKGKHVPGSNNAFAANIQMKRKYRQYMNRRGGFNRPLDFIA